MLSGAIGLRPISRRVCQLDIVGAGGGGTATVAFPIGPQSGAAKTWFTKPGQYACIRYITLGIFFSTNALPRIFQFSFYDPVALQNQFVFRTPQSIPTAFTYYEQGVSGGYGINQTVGGIGTWVNTWPATGVYIKAGDSLVVTDILIAHASDFVNFIANVEFYG